MAARVYGCDPHRITISISRGADGRFQALVTSPFVQGQRFDDYKFGGCGIDAQEAMAACRDEMRCNGKALS